MVNTPTSMSEVEFTFCADSAPLLSAVPGAEQGGFRRVPAQRQRHGQRQTRAGVNFIKLRISVLRTFFPLFPQNIECK